MNPLKPSIFLLTPERQILIAWMISAISRMIMAYNEHQEPKEPKIHQLISLTYPFTIYRKAVNDIAFFAMAVLAGNTTGLGNSGLNQFVLTFLIAHLAYNIFHLMCELPDEKAIIPAIFRTLSDSVCFGSNIGALVRAGVYMMGQGVARQATVEGTASPDLKIIADWSLYMILLFLSVAVIGFSVGTMLNHHLIRRLDLEVNSEVAKVKNELAAIETYIKELEANLLLLDHRIEKAPKDQKALDGFWS